ncbi:M28 family peptidase [Abyssalbus ytuae]|uniref:M20/M25/M40 family metallo-hydrolase n=1 Tax=Abyssalbus ytuae TaxID=2926907 RepID=A0A9E7CUJ1_9FLAO|nr:M20/M25/M40 family metallo-hydrolase [Abyssalbus ytuae]UOB18522.1 M20/M25/M40 family metallo-hydrolase [Abyssalbus ytuae]
MKYILLSLLMAVLSCKSSTNSVRPDTILRESKGDGSNTEIPAMNVEGIMEYLASDELAGRHTGSPEMTLAADYIEHIFKENNVAPYFSTYKDTLTNFKPVAYNIVGYVEGNTPQLKNEFVVIGAHYDHIGIVEDVNGDIIANGANDNASGCTAVIELAKHFGNTGTNKRSLLFVLFSAEEKGLLGSVHLAKKLKGKINLYTMVNFEMIGVPMSTPHRAYLTGFESSNMARKINQYSGKDLIGFLPQAKEYNLFKRSDNYPFYLEFKVPAQTISTFDFTNYNYYHHADDEVEFMDYKHMSSLIEDMIPVIEKITNTATKEITLNE